MAQVKFYATPAASYAALVTNESVDAGGVYFVEGGELYKGTSRFGANKVWTTKPDGNAGVIGGDMYINNGVAEVFNGSEWVGITDANKWSASSYGGEGSYIQAIEQGTDGTVTATVVAFPTLDTGDNDGEVKLGSDSAKVSGWDELVASVSANASGVAANASAIASNASAIESLDSRVSAIEGIVDASSSTVTADTGVFTNLTVSDTATFNATTVSASTLTVGGSDISVLISAGADARISAATLNGSISASDGTGLVNEGQVVNYVSAAISTLDNAMHFVGAGTSLPTSAEAGDVYVFTADATDESGHLAGQEVVYTGSAWEVIGDQNNYVTTAAFQASWSTLGTAAFVDAANAVTADATTLPTCSAVATYVGSQIASAIDALAGSSSAADKGVLVEVVSADGEVTTVNVGVTLDTDIGPSTGEGAATDSEIPSSLAVRKAINDAALVWLDASGTPIA